MSEIFNRLSARTLRWVAGTLLAALLSVGGAAFALGKSYVNSQMDQSKTYSAETQEIKEQVAALTSAVSYLVRDRLELRQEMTEYRQEVKELRKDQIEVTKQIQRAVDALERSK
jgi:peptidoglycan hydrolase CwlO-like protein